VRVRAATRDDAPAIARIYNDGIADRVATFETRPRSAADVERWFGGKHPLVVVDGVVEGFVEGEGSEIMAFASTSEYRPRECYAGIAEFSVYVAREWRGLGAGRMAMQGLIDAARGAGFWKLVSRVFVENAPSRTLLQTVGFREVGVYEKHGRLDGVWRDVVIVERLIPENLGEGA
jgi:phosphinothricin acetyltransferase